MKLPFSIEQFLNVFQSYNETVWPMQIFLNLLAILCIVLLFRKTVYSGRLISLIIAFLWLWMGVVYNIIFFAGINKAAYIFGSMFIIESLLFFYYGVLRAQFEFKAERSLSTYAGLLLIIFALLLYPLLGLAFGHTYPKSPTFGLPCPTTIFTLGVLFFLKGKITVKIVLLPLIWSAIGFSAALTLGIFEDTGLLLAGLITVFVMIVKKDSSSITQTAL